MKTTWKWWAVALALFFLTGYSAVMTANYNTVKRELETTQKSESTVIRERDNALSRAEQWETQYTELLFEYATMKGSNEELEAQIDELREPPDGISDDEFGYDYDYVVRVVGAEARGEPFAGMLAVAQCIADTAERTGMTPEQVVKSGQYTSPVSRSCTDNMETVNEACLLVFAEHQKPFDEPIEYFYSTANGGYSAWHESQVFCYEIGNHRYFKRVG